MENNNEQVHYKVATAVHLGKQITLYGTQGQRVYDVIRQASNRMPGLTGVKLVPEMNYLSVVKPVNANVD